MYREARKITLSTFATLIDARIPQVEAYESGTTRIAASRLWRIADVLDISVVRLFQKETADAQGSKAESHILTLFGNLPQAQKARAVVQMRRLSDPQFAAGDDPGKPLRQ